VRTTGWLAAALGADMDRDLLGLAVFPGFYSKQYASEGGMEGARGKVSDPSVDLDDPHGRAGGEVGRVR